jgi:hypothetical protein
MLRPPATQQQLERRRDIRHEVHLKGRLRFGENVFPLEIGDLSIGGALILVKGPPPAGATAELWIEDYGPITIEIRHSGAYFCGVAFVEPAAHRLSLRRWLTEDSGPQPVSQTSRKNHPAPLVA